MVVFFKRTLRWLKRFPFRGGYGVHSPFAFQFITGVIYENAAFYAYQNLREATQRGKLRPKDYRLLVRIANFQQAKRVFLIGKEREQLQIIRTCLEAGCKKSLFYEFVPQKNKKADLVIATNWLEKTNDLLRLLSAEGLLILIDIGSSRERRKAWKNLIQQGRQNIVSFDLYDFGLIFFRPHFQPAHYVVNYF